MVFFIPWRVVAEESGAAHLGFSGALPTDLLDRREPPRRQMARSTSRASAISF